jgi:predicted O-linked N-acetylglucosamine transferase (SPINDLY family)
MAVWQQALALDATFAEAWANIGDLLASQGRTADAAAALERAVQLKPDFAEAYNNLGGALKELGRRAAAHQAYAAALRARPDYAMAHYNRGVLLRDEGSISEGIEEFRAALAIKPDYALAHSGLVFAMLYDPRFSPQEIRREHDEWNRRHAAPLLSPTNWPDRDANPDRRLRVGYVSADFREHAVARNVHPLLRHHDHVAFEIYAYASVAKPDAMTARLRGLVDHWHDVRDHDDAALAQLVREDRIDVLVDLNLHTGGHRLLTFARKPAPVQATFAGYPGTTGLTAIDYRLTDPYLDPIGHNDAFYSERSYRLAHSFWCFDPLDDDPRLWEPRQRESLPFTWGCLNNPLKTNAPVLALWARVLAATPTSRMLILAHLPEQRDRCLTGLAAHGIAANRIDFLPTQSRSGYLAAYNRCHAILDTFPYNGHTTTCDALWMGVPLVTLAGEHALARGGLSLLSNLDLSDLAAQDADGFVTAATRLAEDRKRLAVLHATLRSRMERSPLMDASAFAREIEAAFRTMWRTWCATAQ